MSFNRENIIWQSKDGTWSIGFYEVLVSPSSYEDENWDSEWDVDYNQNSFDWVSVGHPTAEAARFAWKGSNPGSHTYMSYDETCKETLEDIATLDRIAWRHLNPEKAAEQDMVEHKKNKREARKESLENLADVVRGSQVRIYFDDSAPYKSSTSYSGKLVTKDEWLGIMDFANKFRPVIKADNSALHPNVYSASVVNVSSRDRYGYSRAWR